MKRIGVFAILVLVLVSALAMAAPAAASGDSCDNYGILATGYFGVAGSADSEAGVLLQWNQYGSSTTYYQNNAATATVVSGAAVTTYGYNNVPCDQPGDFGAQHTVGAGVTQTNTFNWSQQETVSGQLGPSGWINVNEATHVDGSSLTQGYYFEDFAYWD